MNFYKLGALEARIKLGIVTPWTPEELRAHQAKFLQRLEPLPDIPENIFSPEFTAHAGRMAAPAQIAVESGVGHPAHLALQPSLSKLRISKLRNQESGPATAIGRPARIPPALQQTALAPQARSVIPIDPTVHGLEKTVATPAAHSGSGAIARLKQLLRRAPKG